jgi:DNA-binding NarL/FixJ family response regulator
MLRAVLEAADGRRYLTHDLAQQVAMLRIRPRRDNLSMLSPREYEVFRLVSTGLSQTDIARALSLSTRSVANYTSLVKRKLNVSTTAELVHLAVRNRIIEIPG